MFDPFSIVYYSCHFAFISFDGPQQACPVKDGPIHNDEWREDHAGKRQAVGFFPLAKILAPTT
jgi:hypothetical protein